MSVIGNKKVSQLTELTFTEVAYNDLFYIVDTSAKESKKISAIGLSDWLNISGSIQASHAVTADTASWAFKVVGDTVGTSSISTFATNAATVPIANLAFNAISSSYALTASFALNATSNVDSASFLIYTGTPNGTASYAIKSLSSDISTATQFLLYFGGNNGTASHAITAETAVNANTASYINNTGTIASASHAINADTASYLSGGGSASSASYLIFSPNNGTASYAMTAGSQGGIKNYGIFFANTQSSIVAQLDDVDIFWSTSGSARTPIRAEGTIIVPFTSSIPTNGTASLFVLDRNSGIRTLLDSTPISFFISSSAGSTGSIRNTFSLVGQDNLHGSYLVFVSASNNIQFESTRRVRFDISSESDFVSSYVNEPLSFSVSPSTVNFTFTSPGAGSGNIGAVYTAGLTNIRTLNAINQSVTSLRYLWTMPNLTASNFSNNPFLSFISNVPNTMSFLSCSNCGMTSFFDFSTASLLSVFNCSNNSLTSLPTFPVSMSFLNCASNTLTSLVNLPATLSSLDCSSNSLTTLPSSFPFGLARLFLDNNNIPFILSPITDTVVTMSINNNPSLSTISFLPKSMSYFSADFCTQLLSLPNLPSGSLRHLSVSNTGLNSFSIDDLSEQLVSGSLTNGYVNVQGTGTPSNEASYSLAVLFTNGWTVLRDP